MKRHSVTVWSDIINDGNKNLALGNKPLNIGKYSYKSKLEDDISANPGELMAAAHARSFSIKLSTDLIEAGFAPEMLETKCDIILVNGIITKSELLVTAKVTGISKEEFQEIAKNAIQNCPVSKALNLKIKLKTTLENNIELINRLLNDDMVY